MTRAALVLLAFSLVVTALGVPVASGQTQEPDLNELWQRYPLDPPEEGPRDVGGREERGSTAGPPPESPGRAGPFPLVLLFLALALTVVGVAGAVRQAVLALRARRRSESRRLGAGAGDLGR
jgi:hypothetical protein